jgi:TRAP-type transport system periplasmic protein
MVLSGNKMPERQLAARSRRLARVGVREESMRLFSGLSAVVLGGALSVGAASAQEIQERTIRWGHLNNTDHPISFGVKRFAEILSAKSGGKLNIREFPSAQLGNELQQQFGG